MATGNTQAAIADHLGSSNVGGHDEVDFITATATHHHHHHHHHNNNNEYEYNDYSTTVGIDGSIISSKATSCAIEAAAATLGASPKATKVTLPNTNTHTTTATTTTTTTNEPNASNNTVQAAPPPPPPTKPKERRALFSFGKKSSKSQVTAPAPTTPPVAASGNGNSGLVMPPVPIGTPPRTHKFVKSSSIARLLGNTYNAKKFEKQEQKRLANEGGKFNTYGGRRRSGPYLERFKRMSKEDGDIAGGDDSAVTVTNVVTLTTDSRDLFGGTRNEHVGRQLLQQHEDISAKAMRTLTRGLGKLWWKRTHSVDISTPDPEFKVSYLGNVLTGWAKGEGCVEKQLNTLWRNYTQHNKPDVVMRVKVCASGLKATTRQHGLTEYWANRVTYCCAPKNYPRVFCWIYRHEGRKLKHELRCHAVLCSKEKIAQDICDTLKENLESALREFKREKILKQNARLSLANAVYDNPSLPRRKIMLSVGGNNYRPPLERSKSAPKLMAIEEAIGEEEGDEIEDTNEPEMRPCCQRDSLYPAMTLGRRRCRRGHSIRRTGKIPVVPCCSSHTVTAAAAAAAVQTVEPIVTTPASDGSDSDDFEKLLKYNDYDTAATLSTELLPYFDLQLHKNTSQSLGSLSELKEHEDEPLSLLPTINSDPSADPQADYETAALDAEDSVGLRRSGVCSDGEEEDFLDDADDHYFRQAAILTMMHRSSMRKMASEEVQLQYRHQQQSSISSSTSTTSSTTSATAAAAGALSAVQHASNVAAASTQSHIGPDSDEGSISSGCETASTVTNGGNGADELAAALKYSPSATSQQRNDHDDQVLEEIIYQRLQLRNNSDATNYSSSSSITLKLSTSPSSSLMDDGVLDGERTVTSSSSASSTGRSKRSRKHSPSVHHHHHHQQNVDSDSECSDESGYVEFPDKERVLASSNAAQPNSSSSTTTNININTTTSKITTTTATSNKPLLPPKPMPRRSLSVGIGAGTAV